MSRIWPAVGFPRPIRESDRTGDPLNLGANRARFKRFVGPQSFFTTEKYIAILAQ